MAHYTLSTTYHFSRLFFLSLKMEKFPIEQKRRKITPYDFRVYSNGVSP